jgi:putative DNA-invertase from lambdoid prophage Rac
MRYIIFSRVSTGDQKVANQMKECRLYVESKLKPKDELIEFEEPATSTRIPMEDREVLQEMLETVRKGDTVVVYLVDRLARDVQELVNIYFQITRDQKAKLHSLGQGEITDTWIGMYATFASMERKLIRERTITGLNRKKADMEQVGTAWYGYKADPTRLQMENDRARSFGRPYLLIPAPEEQENLRVMKALKAKGLSYGEIEKEMARSGCKNRKGSHFQKTSIFRILKREEKRNQAPMELASH